MRLLKASKISLMLLVLSFIPILLSCAEETIPDVPWEVSLGAQGSVVFTTLSSNMVQRTPAQFMSDWLDLNNPEGPMLCTRTSFFAELKAFQESECSTAGNCTNMTPMQSQQFLQFMSNLNTAQALQLKEKKK